MESFYKMCVIEKTSSHFNNNLKGTCPPHPTPFKEAIVRSQEIKKTAIWSTVGIDLTLRWCLV